MAMQDRQQCSGGKDLKHALSFQGTDLSKGLEVVDLARGNISKCIILHVYLNFLPYMRHRSSIRFFHKSSIDTKKELCESSPSRPLQQEGPEYFDDPISAEMAVRLPVLSSSASLASVSQGYSSPLHRNQFQRLKLHCTPIKEQLSSL